MECGAGISDMAFGLEMELNGVSKEVIKQYTN